MEYRKSIFGIEMQKCQEQTGIDGYVITSGKKMVIYDTKEGKFYTIDMLIPNFPGWECDVM